MTLEISHFSLRLYAFHLRNSGKGSVRDAENIWLQCLEFSKHCNIVALESLKDKLPCYRGHTYSHEWENETLAIKKPEQDFKDIELLDERAINFTLTPTGLPSLDCYLYPVLLHDTYCVTIEFQINSAIDRETLDDILNYLRECVQYFQPSIGRTFLVSLQSTGSNCDLEQLSKTCLQKLFNTNPTNTYSSQLFGSPIISYDLLKLDYKIDTDNKAASDRLLVWNVNNPRTQALLKPNQRYIRQLFCFYHKILYIRYVSILKLDRALDLNDQVRDVAKELKRLIANETLVSTSVQECLDFYDNSLNKYQAIITPIREDFHSLDTQALNYQLTVETLQEEGCTESELEFLYKLPANFDIDIYRLDNLWNNTRGWFLLDEGDEWAKLHDIPVQKWSQNSLDGFKNDIKRVFGFPFPESWWQNQKSVINIHKNLQCLCGGTFCGSDGSIKKPISIGSAYFIALIAYVKIFKCTDLTDISLIKEIDWSNCGCHSLFAVQEPIIAQASARALYKFFCALFRAEQPQIKTAFFDRNGAQLQIQLWDAEGKFSKFNRSDLTIPDTVANTSEAILQLWRFMLPSEQGFMSPGSVYMKKKLLILSSAE